MPQPTPPSLDRYPSRRARPRPAEPAALADPRVRRLIERFAQRPPLPEPAVAAAQARLNHPSESVRNPRAGAPH